MTNVYHTERTSFVARLYSPVTRWEVALYCLFAAILIAERFVLTGGPSLSNDSYQYISVASNLAAGQGPQTSLIYFDTEQSWQRVPAPLTTFPLAYPAAIASLYLLGMDPATAGFAVSALAGILLVPLIYWGARLLNCSGFVTRLLLLGLIVNAWFAFYSVAVRTESLFTLVSTAALLALMTALTQRENDGKYLAWLITAHILIGLAYWIRYAGLFLFCAIGLYFVLSLWRQREAVTWQALVGLGLSGGIITTGMLRNFMYVGTWKGGNDKVASRPLFDVGQNYVLQFHHLFMGGVAQPRLWLVDVLFLLGALVMAGMASRHILSAFRFRGSSPSVLAGNLLGTYILVYCGAILYLGKFSVIDIDPRMFYPLLPSFLLMAGLFLSPLTLSQHPSKFRLMVLVLAVLYFVNNGYHYLTPEKPAPHQVLAQQLSAESNTSANLMAWIAQHVPPETTIVANEGQGAGYLLQRRTVSLVSDRYSSQVWDEDAIRRTLSTYRATYLFMFKERKDGDQVISKSSFLNGLTEGRIPSWLELATQNSEVIILRKLINWNSASLASIHAEPVKAQ